MLMMVAETRAPGKLTWARHPFELQNNAAGGKRKSREIEVL
jgi:hypothetical protein